MLKHGKMQRIVMGVLAAMLVASLVLTVMVFVAPKPVAATYCEWQLRMHMCDYETSQHWEYWCYHCYNHPDCNPPGSNCDLYCEWRLGDWPGPC